MQRKRFIYLLAILALLASMLPLAAAAQEAPTASYQIEEFTAPENKDLEQPAAAGAALFYAPDGMNLFSETEPNDTAATANALAGSQAVVYGNVSPANDVDYFSFSATAGDRVYAAMQTQWSNVSGDSRLQIIASDGTTVLEFDDDDGAFSSLASSIAGTVIPATGTYYVRAYGYSATTVITPYHLHVRVQSGTPTAEVEPNNTTATANPLPANGWVSGNMAATTDPDVFSFSLNAGDSVYLALDQDPGRATSNSAWDARLGLGLFGDAANMILVASGSTTTKPNSEAFFMTVQQAGTYYAYIDSTSATGLGANALYNLSVSIYPKATQQNCTTFTSSDVPKAIGPGVGTTTSTITVPGTVTSSITDINATIVLTHSLMADLDVNLVGPTGVNVPLFTDVGAAATGGQIVMNVGLDDQAALPIGTFTVVAGMINQPEQPGRLSTFNGTPAGGTWTLQLADDLANNGGRLQSWSLEICGDPPPAYGVELNKTVGTVPAVCATTDSVVIPPGFDVYYCYTVRNTGLNTLTTHDLVDSELGTLFTGMSHSLAPGATYSYIEQATIYDTVTNTGTWTAHGAGGSASDSDTATVTVRAQQCPVGYQPVTLDATFFDNPFPPAGWSVTNTTTGCNAAGAVPEWTNTNPGNRVNLTGGAGPFAIGDSDKCGSGSLMDTIMTTGALDFTGLVSPTLSYNTDYYDLSGTAGAQALVDVSTDGGGSWTNLLTWNGSHRGPLLVTQPLTGAAGQSNVQVRWHYAQAGWDYWWQVDSAFITACEPIPSNPAITLDKTVGTDPTVCAATDQITVAAGTDVTYCYEVTNTGDVSFNTHNLVDSELGALLTNFSYTLTPGASAFITETATINVTTVNTATWTASTLFEGGGVSASDVATVTVQTAGGPAIDLTKTVGVVPAVCAATDNITVTAGTTVYYCYEVENTGTVVFNFHDLVDSELGTLLNDFPTALAPGGTTNLIVPATPMVSVTNVATWTAMSALGAYLYDDTVAFNYIPINATGTALNLTDDGEANISIPFAFTFYGVSSSNLRVGNNGGILFNATTGDVGYSNAALPNAGHPLAIFPFWDDMGAAGNVYWEVQGSAPNRMLIVEWYEKPHYSNVGAATFEAILYEGSNEIKYQYLDTDFGDAAYNFGASATVGINKDATTALQYSYNQPVITNNKAIRFYQSTPVSAWDSDSATVTVQTPNIDVSPLSLSETHTTPPQSTSQTLTVANTGGGTLTWNIAEEPAVVLVQPDAPNAAVSAPAAGATGSRGSGTDATAPIAYSSPADFSEGFADITNLPGWYMQNNSAPLGLTDWFQGNDTVFPAHAGAPTAYIGANFNNTSGAGTISNWLLTPQLNLSNGDTFSFWTRTAANSIWADRLQVRLSTAGASTNVGTLATDVGDFTTLLLDINPTLVGTGYPQSWTQYTVTLSGVPANASGRLAFRYFVTDGGPSGNNSNYIGIDTVEYTSAGAPAACSAPASVPWLSFNPTSGSTAGGGSTAVTVGFDSTGLANGTYNANLCITSNDPDAGPGNGTNLVVVPVTLIVGEPTAVTLDGLSAAQAALPAAAAAALGAAFVWRRRRA